MEITKFETTVLVPSDGMHIRNKMTGTIAEAKVFLGINDSVDNYEEVTEEQYQAWIEETNVPIPEPEEPINEEEI